MIKILGIFAFVLLYYCEINAEIGRYGKATTKYTRKGSSKKTFSGNYSFEAQPRAKLTTRFPEGVGNPLLKFTKKNDETLSTDLRPRVVEARRTNNRDEKKGQQDKKVNTEKARNGKIEKNENKNKNIHRDKHTAITTERKNGHIIKLKEIEEIKKRKDSKKRNQAVGKSNKHNKRTTSTSKQRSKPVRVGVVYKTRGGYRQGSGEGGGEHGDHGGEHFEEGGEHVEEHGEHVEEHGKHGDGGGEHGDGGGEHGDGGGEHGDGGDHKWEAGGHGEHDHAHHGDPSHKEKSDNPSYLSPYAIMAQMEELMKEFPNANATVTKFARTVEYNDIVLVSVSEKTKNERFHSRAKDSKYIDDAPEKKIIFLVHGLTVMGLNRLKSLTEMSQLKLLFSYYFKHLDKFDFYIIPLANPDGYSAGRNTALYVWNKNMSPQSVCPGVFVDRNFDIAWNNTKDISSCSQLFPGDAPFSEVESKAVRDVFHYYSHKILAYIHVHAGTFTEKDFKGDAILYPRGFTETQSDDDKYIDLKGEIDETMKNASFRVMSVTVDTLANWYGTVSGTSVDYAAAVFGIPYALEFVMQIYESPELNNAALTQIWSRLIDTTIINMWKSLHHASEERKSH